MATMPHADSKPRRPRRLLLFVLIALLLCAGSLMCATLLLPSLPYLISKAQVQANAARYDEVIRMIQAATISGGSFNGDSVTLPSAYQDLSPARNGQVLIYRDGTHLRVLFYPSSISPYTTQVYMYSSQDVSSTDIQGNFQGECSGIARERPNWYLLHCP